MRIRSLILLLVTSITLSVSGQSKFYFSALISRGNATISDVNYSNLSVLKNAGQSSSGSLTFNYKVLSFDESSGVVLGTGYEGVSTGQTLKNDTSGQLVHLSTSDGFIPLRLSLFNNITPDTEFSIKLGYLFNVATETVLSQNAMTDLTVANGANWITYGASLTKNFGKMGFFADVSVATIADKKQNFAVSTVGLGLGFRLRIL